MNATPKPPLVELVGITKQFGEFVANDDVSLTVRPGTVHALLGENGAGKSTLVKCLLGFHAADEGQIRVDGEVRFIRSPHDAHGLGIGMVYQHFTLVPAMTVAENFLLARPDLPWVVHWAKELNRINTFLQSAPFWIDPQARASQLAAGQRQKVEILKQLYLKSRVLVLDEPTSVLTPDEAAEVLGRLRQMAENCSLSVLLITHKFREVTRYCDEVTVLRRGRVSGRGSARELNTSALANMMVGERGAVETVTKTAAGGGAPALEAEGLRADGDAGVEALRGVTFNVRTGEILGVAGVSGNGQRELVEVFAGQRRALSGTVRVHGREYQPTRRRLLADGLHVLPEEPLRNACAPSMTIAENLAMRKFDRSPLARWGWWLNDWQVRVHGRRLIERFDVKAAAEVAPLAQLSGGNVQRAVLARELGEGTARVLIVANPCFGLDFTAVEFIHARLLEARNQGAAVLLLSEDLDELLELCDRLVVMAGGRIVHESARGAFDVGTIGRHMAGLH
jgi:simple sugar transport system ATP-binding protein